MKVFISWSGKRSKYVADYLNEWIPRVIQSVEPWLSAEMPKGVRWSPEVATALDETRFGVFCVTPENQSEPWINFEAGAVSKTVREKSYVCAYLLGGIKPTDIVGPLKDFQATNPDKEDTFRLMKTMNQAQGEKALNEKVFEESFGVWWPKLEEKLMGLPPSDKSIPGPRDERSIQEETLETVRQITRTLAELESSLDLVVGTIAEPPFPAIRPAVGGARVIGGRVQSAPGTERRSSESSEKKDDEKK